MGSSIPSIFLHIKLVNRAIQFILIHSSRHWFVVEHVVSRGISIFTIHSSTNVLHRCQSRTRCDWTIVHVWWDIWFWYLYFLAIPIYNAIILYFRHPSKHAILYSDYIISRWNVPMPPNVLVQVLCWINLVFTNQYNLAWNNLQFIVHQSVLDWIPFIFQLIALIWNWSGLYIIDRVQHVLSHYAKMILEQFFLEHLDKGRIFKLFWVKLLRSLVWVRHKQTMFVNYDFYIIHGIRIYQFLFIFCKYYLNELMAYLPFKIVNNTRNNYNEVE